jgi:hypothetical protein
MNLRRAAIGIMTAGGLTIGLAVGFGPLGARGQLSGPTPQTVQQPGIQQDNSIPSAASQQADQFPPLTNKQIPQYPPPVLQPSAGYIQQFSPLSQYMRPWPLRTTGQQGFASPASKPVQAQSLADERSGSPISSWRSRGSADDEDSEQVLPRTAPSHAHETDETRPALQRTRHDPFDDEPLSPPSRLTYPPGTDDEKTTDPVAKSEGYASDLSTKNNSDPYIQYSDFAPVSLDAPQRLVNSKKISLQYTVKNAGPSGVALVEVWRTSDGRKWEKFAQQVNARPPFVVEVEKEGLYGFMLIPRSGAGLARKPPVDGESPQLWLEVDLSPPQIKLNDPVVGTGRDNGKLVITWTAKDKNLGPDPITISYAEESNGEWKPIASNIRNTGKYVWQMPPNTPYRFLIRVHATDRAGNMGSDQTLNAVVADLATPETVILGADPISQ